MTMQGLGFMNEHEEIFCRACREADGSPMLMHINYTDDVCSKCNAPINEAPEPPLDN